MKKEFEIYQDNKGNVYTITTELEEILLEDLVKLHSIIKEAREYIKSMKIFDLEEDYDIQKLLEILDKVD